MNFLRNAPWTILVFAAVFLLALGAVIVAVIYRYARGDRGLIDDSRTWPRKELPLSVATVASLSPTYRAAFWSVMNEVNALVGKPVFRPSLLDYATAGTQKIHILLDECLPDVEGMPGGTTDLQWDKRKRSEQLLAVKIAFRENLQGRRMFTVFRHEAGHALGLDHDMDPQSVMHETVHHDIEREFTAGDKALLRELYG